MIPNHAARVTVYHRGNVELTSGSGGLELSSGAGAFNVEIIR